ncbi:hypothetical protein GH157_03765 [archaeon]|nr:hypothetical protein [archaeon]
MSLDRVRQRAEQDAKSRGYYLNPSPGFLNDLLEGLKTNEARYGYPSCPCRMSSGFFLCSLSMYHPTRKETIAKDMKIRRGHSRLRSPVRVTW